jgi:hypothetical protein
MTLLQLVLCLISLWNVRISGGTTYSSTHAMYCPMYSPGSAGLMTSVLISSNASKCSYQVNAPFSVFVRVVVFHL